MATQQTQAIGRYLVSPSVILLFVWMAVPLGMTLYFSTLYATQFNQGFWTFVGFENYVYFLTDPTFLASIANTFILVGSVLAINVMLGIGIALLLERHIVGKSIVRLLVIAPFFIMPTVNGVIWKNLLMDPVNGFFTWLATVLGLTPVDWFTAAPLFSIILIVAWQWLPFAVLIFITALQSLDGEQLEAAEMDGAGAWATFRYITLPHLARPITIVILIQTIFLLSIFAEILVTTNGGPRSANLAFQVYAQAQVQFDIGMASAGGVIAVILANIVAFFLVRMIGKNLEA